MDLTSNMEENKSPHEEWFDGNQFSPQMLVALKLLILGIIAPSFGRSHGTSDTSIAGGFSPEKVAFNSNDFVVGLTWDSTNNRFVITAAGRYLITGEVAYSNAADGKQYEAMIYKNGSQVTQGRVMCAAAGAYITPSCTDILNLAVGDYIEIFTQHNEAGASTIASATDSTYITIAKI